MTWRPTPQPPCPCANCNQPPPKPVAARKCTEEDPCKFCGPVERFWATDPAPVEAPPVVPDEAIRSLLEVFRGPSAGELDDNLTRLAKAMAQTPEEFQAAADAARSMGSQINTKRVGIIRRIFNATRRNT